ncbi:hypothetical protein JQC92_15685 [Shewanella sp. 202IG2-18]|nr:hypothetical protein [Parashewanella hymeniacidonis]
MDGVIRIRDGQLDKVEADNNQIIITIKSAGSGGYASTDRFLIKENNLIYSKIK